MKKLFEVKKQMPVIKKDANNPFFKSGYATLSNIIEVIEPILHDNGLFVSHIMDGNTLITRLYEDNAILLESKFALPVNGDIQKIGSAITYARRYNLVAMLNLNVEDDDDGNSVKPKSVEVTRAETRKPKESNAYANALRAINGATDLALMRDRINESTKLTSAEKDSLHKIINERTKK